MLPRSSVHDWNLFIRVESQLMNFEGRRRLYWRWDLTFAQGVVLNSSPMVNGTGSPAFFSASTPEGPKRDPWTLRHKGVRWPAFLSAQSTFLLNKRSVRSRKHVVARIARIGGKGFIFLLGGHVTWGTSRKLWASTTGQKSSALVSCKSVFVTDWYLTLSPYWIKLYMISYFGIGSQLIRDQKFSLAQ